MWKYLLAWIPLVFIAIANGLLREHFIALYLKELPAHQVSTATGLILFSIYMWITLKTWTPNSALQALGVGLMWLGLTVAFEFLFGHYVVGHTWSRLLQDYNILAGRLWVLVLIWVTLAPSIFYKLQVK